MKFVLVSGHRAIAAAVLSFAGSFNAIAASADKDLAGGKDHPVISRYAGSVLYTYGESSLAQAKLIDREKGEPVARNVEGRVNNRLYWGPKGVSALEIFRNYQQALQAAGFETIFSCEEGRSRNRRVELVVR